YHVGGTLVEYAQQKDAATGYVAQTTVNDQPHLAFGTTTSGVLAFADHLRRNNVPFDGPRSHHGVGAVSVYFRDPDGNNLEVSTWEPVPADKCTPMGGPHGFPVWAKLSHDWRPKGKS